MKSPHKRRRLSRKQRAALLQRQGGCCVVFGCTETRNLQEEHSTPHVMTGALPDQLMCKAHHDLKTYGGQDDKSWRAVGGDIRDIAHTKRIAEKRTQADKREQRGFSLIQSAKKLFSRGFDKTKKRTFEGKVVSRDR